MAILTCMLLGPFFDDGVDLTKNWNAPLRTSFVLVCLTLIAGCSSESDRRPASSTGENANASSDQLADSDPTNQAVCKLIAAEDLILDLNFRLQTISRSIVDSGGVLPADFKTLQQVQPLANIDWDPQQVLSDQATSKLIGATTQWPIAQTVVVDQSPINPLGPLLDKLTSVSSAKFGVLSGAFVDGNPNLFEMETKLTVKGVASDSPIGIVGKQQLMWSKQGKQWSLISWKSHSLKATSSDRFIFQDVTSSSLPDKQDRVNASRSYHQEFIDNVVLTGKMPNFGKYTPFVDAASPHALPSVSVVDIDGDQWDDLFISSRWGPTQLLHNNQDGTFTDIAKEIGLQFPNLVNCSAFVDIDNDDDLDAILGRSLEAMVYLRNDGGKFTNVTNKMSDIGTWFMVSAIAVSDINRDGLLDFYCSTYGPFGQNTPGKFVESADWRDKFLTPAEKQTLAAKSKNGNNFVDSAGPPNFIVMNRGNGRLEVAKPTELTQQWHHSYQSSWADVDNDGDDDLYIANDFSSDALLINETPVGAKQPVFTDGLKTCFPDGGVGFGMGVSWSDFDCDGDFDLYVSNMYSKAGARIIRQLENLGPGDPRMEIATRGNFLYVNENGAFRNMTGSGAGQFDVGQVGWSYGGQFMDIDNNGFDDLYVPCGYFTASEAGDSKVDI